MTDYFQHSGIVFRDVSEQDLPFIMKVRNDFSTWTNLGDPRILKPGLQKKWLEGLGNSSDRLYFVASSKEHPQIGLVRMDEYDLVNRSIRVGTDVSPDLRRQGFGDRIFSAMESYAFDYLGLHRVWLLVLDSNKAARKLYTKRGFQVEGRMRQAVFRAGAWRDYISMSLLEESRWHGREHPECTSRKKKGL